MLLTISAARSPPGKRGDQTQSAVTTAEIRLQDIGAARVEMMDAQGIEANDLAAQAVAAHPMRFRALATLPTGDPAAAVVELERCAATLIQTRLLGVLHDRRPTINELGKLLALDKSSVSGLVERAERRGLVTRARSPADGRAVLVSLTDDGRALVSEASSRFGVDVFALLDRVSPSDCRAPSRLVSRLLVAHAADQGVSVFPSIGID
jgi:MarR family transcriptional regulator, lower aerobic nicotinate degradation pathway regulator